MIQVAALDKGRLSRGAWVDREVGRIASPLVSRVDCWGHSIRLRSVKVRVVDMANSRRGCLEEVGNR